jgi:TolA-binding protein
MLAISNCLIELKDLKAAKKAMEELVKLYPTSDAAQTAKDRLARLR